MSSQRTGASTGYNVEFETEDMIMCCVVGGCREAQGAVMDENGE